MGYSKNPETLERIRHLLTDVEAGMASAWVVPEGSEDYWAYKVREAFYIARLYPTRYPTLARMAESMKVEIVGPGKIQAVRGGNSNEVKIRKTGVSVQGLDTSLRTKTGAAPDTLGPQSVESIIQVWFNMQPNNAPIYFPDAGLDRESLLRLHKWTEAQNLIFFEFDGALTLQRKTLDLEALAWDPEDLED